MTQTTSRARASRTSTLLLAAVLAAGSAALAGCSESAPTPPPGEASTGVPLNVGSEDPAATTTEVAP